jgi:hypothetical protein
MAFEETSSVSPDKQGLTTFWAESASRFRVLLLFGRHRTCTKLPWSALSGA